MTYRDSWHLFRKKGPDPFSAELEFTQRVLAQLGFLHLAARRHADRLEVGNDLQIPRHAKVGHARPAPLEELFFGRPTFKGDVGARNFTESRIGHADHLSGLHRGMRE